MEVTRRQRPFLGSFIAAILLTLVVIPIGKRRPVGKSLSWGEAMIAAVYTFFVMFLAFGIVPHQWIDHADNEPRVDQGQAAVRSRRHPQAAGRGRWFPMTLQYEAVRDIVVVILHVIFFGLIIYIWAWWQKRGQITARPPRSRPARTAVRW